MKKKINYVKWQDSWDKCNVSLVIDWLKKKMNGRIPKQKVPHGKFF